MSDRDMSVDPNSVSYMFGQVIQQLEVLNKEQKNIYTRLNKQNGQIGDMSKALIANTEVVKVIQTWRRDCELEEQQDKNTRTHASSHVKASIWSGIAAILSAGLTFLLCNLTL